MAQHLWDGLAAFGSIEVIGLLLVGVVLGVFMGVLPGLGVAMVLSIMLAFVYHLGVTAAIALMLGTQAASYFSASITAILLNSPGAPESMATTFDGHKMAARGEAGKALGISASATAIGGLVGCAALLGLLQVVDYLPNVFHPPEYVAIIVLAVILTATLGTDSVTKAVLSAALGLMISFIGNDSVTGDYRFTFGIPSLYGGISVVALALGSFAIPQMVFMYGTNRAITADTPGGSIPDFRRQVREGVKESLRHWFLLVRSALIGVLCGVIPGIGGFAANFLSYGVAQQTSKNGKKFGTGVAEGIIAPEASSLSKEAGSLVPALGLGLPSGLGMVLFLAALAILGLQPGPGFTAKHPVLPYTMLWAVAIAGLLGTTLGLIAAPALAKVTRVRGPLLFPFIVGLAVVGSFASDASMTTVVEVLCFAFVGIILRRLRYSLAALAVGLVLGPTFEDNVFLTKQIFGSSFIERPLTILIFAICVVVLVAQVLRARRAGGIASEAMEEAARGNHRLLDLLVAVAFVVGGALYVNAATHYSSDTRLLPFVVGSVATVVGALRLIGAIAVVVRSRRAASRGAGPEAPDAAADGTGEAAAAAPEGASAEGTGAAGAEPGERWDPPGTHGSGVPVGGPGGAPWPASRGGRTATAVVSSTTTSDGRAEGADAVRRGEPERVLAGATKAQTAADVGTAPDLATADSPGRDLMAEAQSPMEPVPEQTTRRRYLRETIGFAWVAAMVAGSWLFGFRWAVPVLVLLYGLFGVKYRSRRQMVVFSLCSAAIMYGVTTGIFDLLHLSYSGVLAG
ncbi:MAG TPA: tripartite tricarboxylate transporter permease [Acidimicrobiales bacterium]|nr:tripartite tricarboxylate transporter permease [Acidimicrobiales bacterium]